MRLVPDSISEDTIQALRELLADARSGKAIGIAFVVIYKGRRFVANAAGEARANPTLTRGMIAALDDKLSGEQFGQPSL